MVSRFPIWSEKLVHIFHLLSRFPKLVSRCSSWSADFPSWSVNLVPAIWSTPFGQQMGSVPICSANGPFAQQMVPFGQQIPPFAQQIWSANGHLLSKWTIWSADFSIWSPVWLPFGPQILHLLSRFSKLVSRFFQLVTKFGPSHLVHTIWSTPFGPHHLALGLITKQMRGVPGTTWTSPGTPRPHAGETHRRTRITSSDDM